MAIEPYSSGMPNCATQCSNCGKSFDIAESIWSVLLTVPVKTRKDYCAPCWKGQPATVGPWWKSVSTRQSAADSAKQREQSLFTMLQGEEAPLDDQGTTETPDHGLARRYAAALALWRLRKLRLEQVGESDGREVLRFRLIGSQKRVEVVHPGLSDEQLRSMEEDLLRTVPNGYAPPFLKAA